MKQSGDIYLFDRLNRHDGERWTAWKRTCKQLYAEIHLIPFALNMFKFCTSKSYVAFLTGTTIKQRSIIATLRFYFRSNYLETIVDPNVY